MLYSILLFLLIADSVILLAAILLQAAQGGGLAATFGGVSSSADTLFGSRQTGSLLTKASWWGGALFLALAFVLSLASSRSSQPQSVLDDLQAPAGAPAPANSGAGQAVPLPSAPAPTQPATKKTPPPDSKKP
jgi:preprotein translocase subunit SecG